jgi:hypothetical protein
MSWLPCQMSLGRYTSLIAGHCVYLQESDIRQTMGLIWTYLHVPSA